MLPFWTGGHLVTDNKYAPSWWALADAQGNEACVAPWMNSD